MEDFTGSKFLRFLRRMQNETLAFIGDSLGWQQFQSLMCTVTGGEERPDVLDVGKEYGLVKARGHVRPDGWGLIGSLGPTLPFCTICLPVSVTWSLLTLPTRSLILLCTLIGLQHFCKISFTILMSLFSILDIIGIEGSSTLIGGLCMLGANLIPTERLRILLVLKILRFTALSTG